MALGAWQAGAKHLLLVGGNDLPERIERNELHYREDTQEAYLVTLTGEESEETVKFGAVQRIRWKNLLKESKGTEQRHQN